ncbi:hypothetical protein UA08_07606 [Talaromyces atroroseus]|uniref:Uncharacterized protein n=1 Tax=Talaromyces atroroseus TaxID=1441469 RepID=A0A225AGM2_TALAT|nr:hypothetical protein UA08_07606 [Talaromyces atroroseus]OKL57264.1 hypothetical protein UA08_07606 [Talaromyces atroroseus]
MVDASTSNNVSILRDLYEGEKLSTSSSTVSNAYNENEHRIISNGLGIRVKEVERKSGAKKESTARHPYRSTRSMAKQACEDSAIVEDGKESDSADVQELERENEQAHRETKELVSQIELCELEIEELHEQMNVLKARELRLIQCGEEIKEDLTDQIKDLREKLRVSKLRERELQAQLERSRQATEDLRIELEETKLKAIQQLRQSEARERESELLQHTRREHGQVSLESLQQLVEATAENISRRNLPAANTQQVIYQRHPGDIDTIAQQNHRIFDLEEAKHHAERRAQKYASKSRQANSKAEYLRQELLESRKEKKKQQRGEKVIALSRQRGITNILAYTQT